MGDDLVNKGLDIAKTLLDLDKSIFMQVYSEADGLSEPVKVTVERLDEEETEHQYITFAYPYGTVYEMPEEVLEKIDA